MPFYSNPYHGKTHLCIQVKIEILSEILAEKAASPLPGYKFKIFNMGTRLVIGLDKQNL